MTKTEHGRGPLEYSSGVPGEVFQKSLTSANLTTALNVAPPAPAPAPAPAEQSPATSKE